MKGRGMIPAAVIVALALLLGTAEAGWVIQAESRGGRGAAFQETTYFQKERIRSEGGDHAHIMDFNARRILWIDKKQRKYSSMTFDEFKQFMRESMRQAGAAMEEMKKMGIQVPGQPAGPRGKVTVSKGPGATIAGYACDGYKVYVGGKLSEEIWVTRKVDLSSEMGAKTKKEFEELEREFKKMGAAFRPEIEDPEYAKIHEGGYPMRNVHKESGNVHEVTRAERKEISADLFNDPKGFAKVPFGELHGMPREGTRERQSSPAGEPPGTGAGKRTKEYGKQSADEAAEAEKQGASQPAEEKKSEGLDAIKEGVGGGIKKLFKW